MCVFTFFITRIFDFVWKLQHLSCHLLDYEKVFYTSFLICLLFAFCSFIHSHTDAHILFVIIVFFSFVLRSDSPLFKFNQLMILLSGLVRFFVFVGFTFANEIVLCISLDRWDILTITISLSEIYSRTYFNLNSWKWEKQKTIFIRIYEWI